MSSIRNLQDMKFVCRICLTSSDNMIPLANRLDDSEESPQISQALENIFMMQVEDNIAYPGEICRMCYGNVRILYDLRLIFHKSQSILKKYVSSFQELEMIDALNNRDAIFSDDENIELTNDVINHTEVNEKELSVQDMPHRKIKLKIGIEKQKAVKVKWIEGNRFIIEKSEDTSTSVQCSNCNAKFPSRGKYCSHLKICSKNFSCKYCKHKFGTERSLQYHLKVKHASKSLKVKCDLCDETFKNWNAKSYHKMTRHSTEGKKYACEICGKAFYVKNSLNQHLECHSRDVSRVICPICGKSFHYRGGLFYHMKVHRNERNYVCTFCNGRFLNMASLKRHTRIHTGERPYTCSFCPKTFCSLSEVRTHERRHTGQKPHKCKYCAKCFITPYNCKLHMSSHTGLQPCDVCGKTYLNAEVLKYHMEMKHNIKDVNEEIAT